jgi:hypothetical protein
MTIWEIQGQDGTFGVYLADDAVSDAAHAGGLNPTVARDAFKAGNLNVVRFFLVEPDSGKEIEAERQIISDFLIWSWVPIFSDRAKTLACELGCQIDEFWACSFQSNPGERFFLHLPKQSHDIVDVANSTFLMTIPGPAGVPPLPHIIQILRTKQLPASLPACFRASIPGHQQVFSELFASDEFKIAWEGQKYTGADFRRLA